MKIVKTHNKTLLAQATPAGTAYCLVRPKAGRYAAILRGRYVIGVVDSIALPELQRVNAW